MTPQIAKSASSNFTTAPAWTSSPCRSARTWSQSLAQGQPKKHLTSETKSNGISITMPYWDRRVEAMAQRFPDVAVDRYHVDILTANFVLHPDRFGDGGGVARMVAADRELQLAGYEVHHFSGHELADREAASAILADFLIHLTDTPGPGYGIQ